jgi:exopolysaccharide biosynthesis polyprenyl glycosylphosphotransferase
VILGKNGQARLSERDPTSQSRKDAAGADTGSTLRSENPAASPLRDTSHFLSPAARWSRACLAVDLLMLTATLVAADLSASQAGVPSSPLPWLLGFPLLILLLFRLRGMYHGWLVPRYLDQARAVVTTTALAAMTLLSIRLFVTDDPWAAGQTARAWLFGTTYLVIGRVALMFAEVRARRRGEAGVPTIIVGAGRIGRLTARRLLGHPELGLRPVGYLDKEPLDQDADVPLPVLGASWDLERVVTEHGIQHCVVTFSTAPHHVLLGLIRRCRGLGVAVSVVPRLFENVNGSIALEHLGGLPFMTSRLPNPKSWGFVLKHSLDRLVAAGLLVLIAPVLAVAAVAVWLSVGRPILFRQIRVGRDGHAFEMLKFRTMRSPDFEGPESKLDLPPDIAPGGVEGADRRTRVGSFLRASSIDELPQLINVLRGDMSLVGPRPERPEFAELFEREVYRYGERVRVKGGITGWAQIHGLRGQTSLSERVEWDNYYIENWSLWLDVKILLNTAPAVLRFRRE